MKKYQVFVIFLCWMFMCSGYAQSIEYVPAKISGDVKVFENISIPNVGKQSEIRIYCFSKVDKKRQFGRVSCKSDTEGVDMFLKNVAGAARKLHVEPARINGKRVDVRIQFTISAKRSSAVSEMSIFPHVFLNYKKYGLAYSAPQSYSYPSFKLTGAGCRSDLMVWVELFVDEQGKASNPRIFNAFGASEECLERWKEFSVNTKYIPAFQGGKAVPARHIIPYYFWYSW